MEQENSSEQYSVKVTCEIPLKLPSCNDYIRECRRNKFAAAKMKRDTEDMIGGYIAELPHFDKPVKIRFLWIEATKRRDIDGVSFGKKFILDALVKFGKLTDDNRKYVTAFTDEFDYGVENKVILEIMEVDE